jgi:hypothetical protein
MIIMDTMDNQGYYWIARDNYGCRWITNDHYGYHGQSGILLDSQG